MIKATRIVAAFVFLAPPAFATPISVNAFGDPFEVYHFRDIRGVNSVGFSPSDRLVFGAVNVRPNGKGGTTGTAVQNGVEVPLFAFPSDVNPNEFASGVSYDSALTGSWTLTFRNRADQLVVKSPSPGDIESAGLATDLTLSNPGLTPRLKWTNPEEADRITISIYDLEDRLEANGFANRIAAFGFDGSTNSFRVPTGLLARNHLYSIGVEASITYDGGINPSGSSQAGASRSRSRAFFDFITGKLPGDPDDVFLPQVDTTGGAPIFNFDNAVLADRIAFYDPLVAIGYDYEIGDGDPLFGSVVLPEIGDGLFDLLIDDGDGFTFVEQIMAGVEYSFGDGVGKFRILGIEIAAMLDPANASAFVTGLSFVEDGRFTGTMTPITFETMTAVPLPASGLLLFAGLALTCGLRFRRVVVAA